MADIANLKVERVNVDRLTTHPENPRKGDVGLISSLIEQHGFYGTIVAQKSTGHILAGNHRYMAAKEQGMTSVPVAWVDVDDDEALRIVLADNRASDQASYDNKVLTSLLSRLQSTDTGLAGTGYEDGDLKQLLDRIAQNERNDAYNDNKHKAKDEQIDVIRERWQTEPGQLWTWDGGALLIGDNLDPDNWQRVLDGEQAHTLVTSPPYWVGKEYEAEGAWQDVQQTIERISSLMAEHVTHRIIVNTGTVNAGKLRKMRTHYRLLLDDWQDALEEHGWLMRNARIWDKAGGLGNQSLSPDQDVVDMSWEFIATFYKPETFAGMNRVNTEQEAGWAQNGVWRMPKVMGEERLHSAPFPTELPRRFILLYTQRGDRVIDPYVGSGTTLVAAAALDRPAYGLEIDPGFAALTLDRLANESEKEPQKR